MKGRFLKGPIPDAKDKHNHFLESGSETILSDHLPLEALPQHTLEAADWVENNKNDGQSSELLPSSASTRSNAGFPEVGFFKTVRRVHSLVCQSNHDYVFVSESWE